MAEKKKRVRGPRPDRTEQQQHWLDKFDMMTEEQVATLLGVDVKTLKNRAPEDLPPFSKNGGTRLFFTEDVLAFLKKKRNLQAA